MGRARHKKKLNVATAAGITCMIATYYLQTSPFCNTLIYDPRSTNPFHQTRRRIRSMASSNLSPKFAYTVVYVKDVAKSVDFYAKAFGYSVRRLDESHRWGELESGHTTIAFTPLHQHETDDLTGSVQQPSQKKRNPIEVCFAYSDVDAAFKRAVENGAEEVRKPEEKEWGQKVGYVRDIDGIVVRMGSFVNPPK